VAEDVVTTQHDDPRVATSSRSPLPWHWTPLEMDGDDVINGAMLWTGERSVFTVDCGDWNSLSDADAAFIVRAVNSHDDLLAACKLALETHDDAVERERRRDVVRAAIAKAEAV
jgi:hypothetical protein